MHKKYERVKKRNPNKTTKIKLMFQLELIHVGTTVNISVSITAVKRQLNISCKINFNNNIFQQKR